MSVVYICDTLQNGVIEWHGGDELLNKVIFVFFAQKKYSCSFVKLWLNQWWHMDYFNDVLATFLSLDHVRNLAVYGRDRELSEFLENILICIQKMNNGLKPLGWVINYIIFILGWTIPLHFVQYIFTCIFTFCCHPFFFHDCNTFGWKLIP